MINSEIKMAEVQNSSCFHSHRNKVSSLKLMLFSIGLLACVMHSAYGLDMSLIIPPMCNRQRVEAKINTAVLTIQNDDDSDLGSNHYPVVVFLQSRECYECDLVQVETVNTTCAFRVDARWPSRLEIRQQRGTQIRPATNTCSEASLSQSFTEGGSYTIFISAGQDDDMTCSSVSMSNPADPHIPIYVAMSILLFLLIMWNVFKYLYKRGHLHRIFFFWSTESMMADLGSPTNINQIDDASNPGSEASVNPPVRKERLKSLDTLRGLSIVIMIFVNYGGGKYWFFEHSKWNGLTVADLVFPWFIFIMGTAMAMSFQSQIRRGTPKWKMFAKIVKRSITLFLLGLLVNSFGIEDGVEFSTFRIPGVLQRFAGVYLITATVYLFLAPQYIPNQSCKYPSIRDLTLFWPEWVINLGFVGLHLAITMALPVPSCPSGYLGPGGLEQGGRYFNCVGGAAGYVDRVIFGAAHIYHHPTSKEIYHSNMPYDPEGLLGTLNSCVLCFLGLQAGKILMVFTDWVQRTRRFFIWSLVLGGIGILLCEGRLNEGWIPINKNLWSLSFICVLSGMAFFLLMVLYIMIDVYKVWGGAPFSFAGMNAIALYMGHEFFEGRAPVYFAVSDTHAARLAINLWGTAFWVLVSVYFYYNNIFITV